MLAGPRQLSGSQAECSLPTAFEWKAPTQGARIARQAQRGRRCHAARAGAEPASFPGRQLQQDRDMCPSSERLLSMLRVRTGSKGEQWSTSPVSVSFRQQAYESAKLQERAVSSFGH